LNANLFIDKNKEVVSDLNLEANYEQIHEFLVGKEKVISPKTEEEISNLLNADLYREFREKKIEISKEEFLKLKPFHWGFEFYELFDLDKPKERFNSE
jgi:hypothetical protein